MFQFDSSIQLAIKVLAEQLGSHLVGVHLVRDTGGQIVVVLPSNAIADRADWQKLAAKLHSVLGRQSPDLQRVLLREDDLISQEDVVGSQDKIRLDLEDSLYQDVVNGLTGTVWLVDRLITNQDWIRPPLWGNPPVPVAVAYSIKGGVGRTTSLALWAWHLARIGRNPILCDLDLEAPGIGTSLLPADELPDYGLTDWLVESVLHEPDEGLLQECIGMWRVPHDALGSVRVLPAYGKKSRDYLAKLGRVFASTIGHDGKLTGFAERISVLIEHASRLTQKPTELLIDSRAGLHDIGSAVVTRLAAEVFLFARDDAQGWAAYRNLFGHLSMGNAVQFGMKDNDIRLRMKMVAAQIEPGEDSVRRWIDNSFETWSTFYDEVDVDEVGFFGRDDESAPHHPLLVMFDPDVRRLVLSNPDKRPDWRWVDKSFSHFFEGATARLDATKSVPEGAA